MQGGTFYNDAVLRSFEREIGRNVILPRNRRFDGCVWRCAPCPFAEASPVGNHRRHSDRAVYAYLPLGSLSGCTNHCHLTVNLFPGGEKFISGNKCEKGGLGGGAKVETLPNLHQFKRDKLAALMPAGKGKGRIGIPQALSIYELAPLWYGIFTTLGYDVVFSGPSSREIYSMGQYSIPSDTACYPAKLMHGHVEKLLHERVDAIFYPSLTYNIDEGQGDNHYNCPVVAYYAELIAGNMDDLCKPDSFTPISTSTTRVN